MRFVECGQTSHEWFESRCGRITASRMGDVMKTLARKSGDRVAGDPGKERVKYCEELVIERVTGKVSDKYYSEQMRWGNEQEPFARTAYEISTGNMVDRVGIAFDPIYDFAAASPDGLIGNDGGLEIKCPGTKNHLLWRKTKTVPDNHRYQCLWNMRCAERDWWDFCSFDPRLPDHLQVFVIRVDRDQREIDAMEESVKRLEAEIRYGLVELGCGDVELPPIEQWLSYRKRRARSSETERIGNVDVPCDIAEMLDDERVDLGMAP